MTQGASEVSHVCIAALDGDSLDGDGEGLGPLAVILEREFDIQEGFHITRSDLVVGEEEGWPPPRRRGHGWSESGSEESACHGVQSVADRLQILDRLFEHDALASTWDAFPRRSWNESLRREVR